MVRVTWLPLRHKKGYSQYVIFFLTPCCVFFHYHWPHYIIIVDWLDQKSQGMMVLMKTWKNYMLYVSQKSLNFMMSNLRSFYVDPAEWIFFYFTNRILKLLTFHHQSAMAGLCCQSDPSILLIISRLPPFSKVLSILTTQYVTLLSHNTMTLLHSPTLSLTNVWTMLSTMSYYQPITIYFLFFNFDV